MAARGWRLPAAVFAPLRRRGLAGPQPGERDGRRVTDPRAGVEQTVAEQRHGLLQTRAPARAGARRPDGGVAVVETVEQLFGRRRPEGGGAPLPPTADHEPPSAGAAEAPIISASRRVPLAISLLGSLTEIIVPCSAARPGWLPSWPITTPGGRPRARKTV